jgi:hypothetical protein
VAPYPAPAPEAIIDASSIFDLTDSITVRDLPTLAPPFRDFWVEAQLPERVAVGAHFLGARQDDGRFVLTGVIAYEDGGQIAFPASSVAARLLPSGALSWTPGDLQAGIQAEHVNLELERTIAALSTICFFAISLMHCKNAALREALPNAKISRAGERRGHPPLLRYHVLAIDPVRKILEREGGAGTGGMKQALHICRGHFKDYRLSGLFGKHKGIFWWDMAARGSVERGIVDKDYRIGGELHGAP